MFHLWLCAYNFQIRFLSSSPKNDQRRIKLLRLCRKWNLKSKIWNEMHMEQLTAAVSFPRLLCLFFTTTVTSQKKTELGFLIVQSMWTLLYIASSIQKGQIKTFTTSKSKVKIHHFLSLRQSLSNWVDLVEELN